MRCVWFRQDLRLKDHVALHEACRGASEGVVALYVFMPKVWQSYHWSGIKVQFILERLRVMADELAALNIPLKLLTVNSYKQLPNAIKRFCQAHNITEIYAHRSYLLNEMRADEQMTLQTYHDGPLLPPNAVLKPNGDAFKVFTPYKRRWLSVVTPADWQTVRKPVKQKPLTLKSDVVPVQLAGFACQSDASAWPACEQAAHKRLRTFCERAVDDYKKSRDFPAVDATSQLSPYLANGVLSVRQCLAKLSAAADTEHLDALTEGASCWLSELIWRDFYAMIAYCYPAVVKHKPFLAYTDKLNWSSNEKRFKAWCEGKTGYPIVDAAMRQLNQTGWMHNRLRMVTAMFLTKTLFIDWRMGEAYFMSRLLDGDFASNNGGWQWSASTGTDAAPYFRIFNPELQSQKFDASGAFIRQYCPELSACTAKEIHNPAPALRQSVNYPQPIVDYKTMRSKVIAKFKALASVKPQ